MTHRQSRGQQERSRGSSFLSDAEDILESTAKSRRLDVTVPDLSSVRINSQKSQENKENEFESGRRSNSSHGPVTISTPTGFTKFSSILHHHGYHISTKKNELIVDASEFRKKLSDWCTMTIRDNQQNMKTFVAEMKEYLSNKEYFMIAMSPTLDHVNVYQLSLVQTLLGIETLQGEVFEVLLQKLIEAAHTTTDDEGVEFLNQLMNQMRWIQYFSNEQEFVKEILEIMENAREQAQKTMIRTILDVISPQFHHMVAKTLLKLLENFSSAAPAILENFSFIDMLEEDLNRVREIAIENMSMVEAKDLPAFFAFLFSCHDPSILRETVHELREKVNLDILGQGNEILATTREFVNKIRFCISTNEQIVPAWIKITQKDVENDPELFLTLDLAMFLIFLESNNKLIESPLKQLFSKDKIGLDRFDTVINTHPTIIDLIFEPLSKFLEKLLWSRETKLYAVVTDILVKLFNATSDYNAQQIVVICTSVLAHGQSSSRDNVIEGLTLMATQNVAKFLKFMPLVMGIMDHVIKFPPKHISSIMKVLASAAFIPNNRESARFEVEFSILLRKQLTHNSLSIKCVGVIGSVATIDQLAQQGAEPTKISNLLETTWRAVGRDGEPCFIFFDQLSDLLESSSILPLEISKELKDMLQDKFLENWLIFGEDVHKKTKSRSVLKMQPVMYRNEELEDDDATLKFEDSPVGMASTVLPAHLRLLSLLSGQLNDGDLGDIDMLLGVALLLPEFELYERKATSCSEVQKSDLARFLVLAINYLREACNAFSLQRDPVLITKLWSRLADLVSLHQLLVNFVEKFKPNLQTLPLAYTNDIITKLNQINVFGGSKVTFTKKKPRVNNDNAEEEEEAETTDPDKKESAPKKTKKKKAKKNSNNRGKDFGDGANSGILKPYFRRFHRNVFRLLETDLKLKHRDINFNELVANLDNGGDRESILRKVQILNPQILILLLCDLNMQVETSHLCIIKDVALAFPSDLFDRLCRHLDVLLKATKKSQIGLQSQNSVEHCFLYLYKTIIKYLNEAKTSQYIELYEKALQTMETRAGESDANKEVKISQYLCGNPEGIHNPDTAVQHLNAMKIVYDMGEPDLKSEMRLTIGEVVDSYLQRDWDVSSSLVQAMLRIWLSTTEDALSLILRLAASIIPINSSMEIPLAEPYRSCTRVNFPTWYRILFEYLVQHVSKNLKQLQNNPTRWLEAWSMAINIFKILVMNVIERNQKANIIMPLLRLSRAFLEAWSNSQHGGIKLLIWLWKNKQEVAAQELLKSLKTTTRKIHSVCDHAKKEKSSQLMQYVPVMKKVLETLVFRVRQQLVSNGVPLKMFQIGVLKKKSLSGSLIDSQIDSENDEEDAEDDDCDRDTEPVEDDEGGDDELDEDDYDEDMEEG